MRMDQQWLCVDNSSWFGDLRVSVREVVESVNGRYFERKCGEGAFNMFRWFHMGLAYEPSSGDHSSGFAIITLTMLCIVSWA